MRQTTTAKRKAAMSDGRSKNHQFSATAASNDSSSDEWTKDLDNLPWGDTLAGTESPDTNEGDISSDSNLAAQFPSNHTISNQSATLDHPYASISHDTGTAVRGNTTGGEEGKKRRSKQTCRRNKRAKEGTPKRPLTAYNLFFRDRRETLMAQHRLSFQELGKIIGREWHEIDKATRSTYDKMAKVETDRYHNEMDRYHESRRRKRDEEYANCTAEAQHLVAAADGQEHPLSPQHRSSIPSAASSSIPACNPNIMRLLPPGGTIMMPGADGIIRSYRVEYKTFTVKQKDIDSGKLADLLRDAGAHRKKPPTDG